jgi:hypothetical protein
MPGFAAASYGKFQIMGENHEACGYDNPWAFAAAQAFDEADAAQGVRAASSQADLHRRSSALECGLKLAKGYNGTAYYKNRYDVRSCRGRARGNCSSRPMIRIFPRWPVTDNPSDTRKWVALIVSFGGNIVFTIGAGIMVWIIWKGGWSPATEGKRLDLLGWAMLMLLGGSITGNWAYGFVLNRRTFKISKDGIEASGGDDPAPSVTTTTKTTVNAVDDKPVAGRELP